MNATHRTLIVSYPWTTGNARFMHSAGGIPLAESLANVERLLARLRLHFRVVELEYPPGIARGAGYPACLDVGRVVGDYLAAADAAGAPEFGILGYSWSGGTAIEVAARSARCRFLYVGGWPPIDAPIAALRADLSLRLGRVDASAERAALDAMYHSYYDSLETQSNTPDIPKLVFYGSADTAPIAEGAESVRDIVHRTAGRLTGEGWKLRAVAGRDHMGCLAADAVAEGMGL